MKAILLTILVVYIIGFVLTFVFHMFLPMVTPGLALARSAAWPVFFYNGWPHGTPLPMD